MDQLGSGLCPTPGHSCRIPSVDCHILKAPFKKANTLPLLEINSGNQKHFNLLARIIGLADKKKAQTSGLSPIVAMDIIHVNNLGMRFKNS
jgi:hypothetical protein